MRIYNSRDSFYKTPFGAVKQGETVIFSIALDACTPEPSLVIFKENCPENRIQMHFKKEENGKFIFTVSFVALSKGLYFYRFDLNRDFLGIYNGKKGDGVIAHSGDMFQLTVYSADFTTPDKAKGSVFYQIFPDRFFEGVKKKNLHFDDRIYRKNKAGEPYYYPSEQPDGYLNRDYFGGDLVGICEKLDYLKELGVKYIYLNPIFEAHSNHRYNTADYMKIDPDLGTLEDFKNLCDTAHKKDMYIILDGVFSHTGSDSIYFNREGRYDSVGAFNSPESPYRKWYDFSPRYPCGYRAWWGFDSLPEVNEDNPDFIQFVCGKNGVIDYWLSMGADGFRLDVADELPDEFIEKIRKAVKSHGEDKLLIGEVWEDASNKFSYGKRREYLLGNGLDTTMNYPFRTSILNFLTGGNGYTFSEEIMTICENYPKQALDTAMNSLSTHDTPRAMTALCGENPYSTDRNWQSKRYLSVENYEKARKLIILGYALLFFLPGVPCIYYGDEIGMQGYRDPFNRGYFRWWAIDENILNKIKYFSSVRNGNDIFKEGGIYFVYTDENSAAFVRFDHKKQKEILLCVNKGENTVNFEYKGKNYTVYPRDFIIDNI